MVNDTIFALASAPGKAGVAVIRISGPDARIAAERLAGPNLPERGMTLRDLRNAEGGLLDSALVLTFAGSASFTGEAVAELQVHGSAAGINSILGELGKADGLRQAEAGEFTRRALENGKMDLAQVEGLADLIDAETEAQRRQAVRILSGDLGRLVENWRLNLIRAAALVEAVIDFADEEIPEDVSPEVEDLLSSVSKELERLANGTGMAERIRSGFEVAIVGAPNVGKSTLLNTLAGRKAAITSEIAGTTRDVIEVAMDLKGLPVTLLDTAGLRSTEDHVERLGVELARERAAVADLRIILAEASDDVSDIYHAGDIVLRPKGDLRTDRSGAISGLTGSGVDELLTRLGDELARRAAGAGLATRERHRVAMDQAQISLRLARSKLLDGPDHYDIAAEEIRSAINSLESLGGRIGVDDLLDEIFASFCVGK